MSIYNICIAKEDKKVALSLSALVMIFDDSSCLQPNINAWLLHHFKSLTRKKYTRKQIDENQSHHKHQQQTHYSAHTKKLPYLFNYN